MMKYRLKVILDGAIELIGLRNEWTTWQLAEVLNLSKSNLYYYFKSKEELTRGVFEHYLERGRKIGSVTVDLAMWVAMREDWDLAKMVRDERLKERELLQIEFDGHLEAWLAQAVRVGLGVMREVGVEANDEEIMKLFRELVFANHVRNRAPETKAGIEKELSA